MLTGEMKIYKGRAIVLNGYECSEQWLGRSLDRVCKPAFKEHPVGVLGNKPTLLNSWLQEIMNVNMIGSVVFGVEKTG